MSVKFCAFSGSCPSLLLEADEDETSKGSFPIPYDSKHAGKRRSYLLEGTKKIKLEVCNNFLFFVFVQKDRGCYFGV